MRRRWVWMAAAVVAVAACRRAPPPAPPPVGFLDESRIGVPRDGGTLYRRLEGEPATLNPILQTSDYEAFVLAEISRNLIEIGPDMKPAPGVCDRWEVADGGRTYTLHVRDAAVWEDGTPVTANDVAFTIREIANPAVPAVLFSSNFADLKGVDEVDAKTVRVRFSEPQSDRLFAFNFPLLPASRGEKRDVTGNLDSRHPLADGPYRLAAWRPSQSIELVRNDRYWGRRPHFDRVVFRVLPDPTQAYRALLAGQVDEMRLSTEQWRQARSDAAFRRCCRLTAFYDLSYFYIGFNNRSPLFSDVATRRAATMLLDRPAMIRDLFYGMARLVTGPWPPDSPACDPSVPAWPFDPARARRLLAGAGWKPGPGGVLVRGGRRFEFDLLYGAGSSSSREITEIYARDLAAAGIACHPRPIEWAAFEQRMDSGAFDAVASAWSGDPNPDPYPLWHSSQAPPHGLNNLSYSDPEADRLMKEARRKGDFSKRMALYHRLHRIIHDDAPACFGLQAAEKFAFSRRIGGLMTTPVGPFKFWPGAAAWWDRGASGPR